ncbi:hypothetical protein [Brachybacterium sp. sponge]|uniref:hypothetical protein n=1 Tax=Brachybacterium sp. sponge TaxID=1775432 RepID=UPI0007A371E2|nr:hypothetical protein [Brachybacterium sp. sponge]
MPQPHRGDRKPVSFLTPSSIRDEVDRRAHREGLTRGDYLTRLLALELELPVPSYIPGGQPGDAQLRLPDSEAQMSA